MSRTSNTAKRHASIDAKHKLLSAIKPLVANKNTSKAKRKGFDKVIKAKQSKGFKSSIVPTNKHWS